MAASSLAPYSTTTFKQQQKNNQVTLWGILKKVNDHKTQNQPAATSLSLPFCFTFISSFISSKWK